MQGGITLETDDFRALRNHAGHSREPLHFNFSLLTFNF